MHRKKERALTQYANEALEGDTYSSGNYRNQVLQEIIATNVKWYNAIVSSSSS